jgi:hypothetical protein
MKVLLDVKDNKAKFIMELLTNFSFVKAKQITNEKALLIEDIKDAVEELSLIKQGKIKGIPAKQLLDEL